MVSNDIDHGLLFVFIKYSAIIWGIFSIMFLKPHRFIKKLVVKMFQISFKFEHNKIYLYHVVLLWIFFYGILFACNIYNHY